MMAHCKWLHWPAAAAITKLAQATCVPGIYACELNRQAAGESLTRISTIVVLIALCSCSVRAQEPSTCYGTTDEGSLENGWKLPSGGANFTAYSTIGSMIGRTYVHSEVHSVVLEAYVELSASMPGKKFVYGETGKENGGKFDPHKTHRNGLSVDFMVPVLNKSGDSVPLPTNVLNKWGYELEFDSTGLLDGLTIDAKAMAEHIYQLHRIAEKRGIGIWRVIFDPQLQPLLHNTSRWPYLRDNVEFSQRRSWVRHDEHYHIDFIVQCQTAD